MGQQEFLLRPQAELGCSLVFGGGAGCLFLVKRARPPWDWPRSWEAPAAVGGVLAGHGVQAPFRVYSWGWNPGGGVGR